MKIFMHGVADTAQVWNKVRSKLSRFETIALALPGFGNDPPAGFSSDKESYVQWIVEEIESVGTPVDLIGHDWGGMFALRIASLRPDLIRSVASGNGPVSATYEWHQLAKDWQKLGKGEELMRELDREKFSELLRSLGVDERDASSTSEQIDDRMKAAILRLYRSAIHVGEEWAPELSKIQCPTLIYWGKDDAECPIRFAHEMSEHIPNSYVVAIECGHWVPLQAPESLAHLLENHWEKLEANR
jgi:pimeloyl-ACP methyl ester carboxylesterase